MLELIIIVLIVLWLLGFFGGLVTSSLIHILLAVALVILVIRLARGERIV